MSLNILFKLTAKSGKIKPLFIKNNCDKRALTVPLTDVFGK